MPEKPSVDRAFDRVEQALHDLTKAVGELTTTIAVQAKSLSDIEGVLESDGGIAKQVAKLRFEVDHLIERINVLESSLHVKSEKTSERLFELFKLALPWICAVVIGWLTMKLK